MPLTSEGVSLLLGQGLEREPNGDVRMPFDAVEVEIVSQRTLRFHLQYKGARISTKDISAFVGDTEIGDSFVLGGLDGATFPVSIEVRG